MSDEDLERLKEEHRKMGELLNDPQLGLMSWWEMLGRRMGTMEGIIRKEGHTHAKLPN